MHLFGSLQTLRAVLQDNSHSVGGNWGETLSILNQMETECCQNFGVEKVTINSTFEHFLIRSHPGTLSMLQSVFPKCCLVKDSGKPGRGVEALH